jgi:hypothetical protein
MLEPEYFDRKRRELGMDRADSLAQVQEWLNKSYPGLARAKSLHRGVLRIITPNASVASEIRMRQLELLSQFGDEATRLSITISTLD